MVRVSRELVTPRRVGHSGRVADALDFLAVDDLLGQEERDVRDTVRAFADAELAPYVSQWYDSGRLPDDLGPRLGKLGLLGMHLDGYGCAGTSATAYGVACRELEAVDSGLRSFVSVQGSLAMFAIHHWGSDEHKEEWLPRMATGEALGCFGLTEADAGSDPASMRTRARRDGADWLLTGSKMWITNGTVADVAVVWARVDTDGPEGGIRGFVVPTDTGGFTATEIGRKLSLRASVTAELSLEEVRLPADAVLPEVRGLKGPLTCLNEARYGILWGAVGAARACYAEALAYTLQRSQFGQPIASFQLTQRKLAEMAVAVNNASLVAVRLGHLKDDGRLSPAQVSYGKLANVRAALDTARTARSVLGGAGITLDHSVMRHMNNLETVLTYEGTEEMHTLSVGAELTGIRAFR
jgi:glutaryl-CoA dehydrogenase